MEMALPRSKYQFANGTLPVDYVNVAEEDLLHFVNLFQQAWSNLPLKARHVIA
jgi:hypothetical protein